MFILTKCEQEIKFRNYGNKEQAF